MTTHEVDVVVNGSCTYDITPAEMTRDQGTERTPRAYRRSTKNV
jgi:hypothetical protein